VATALSAPAGGGEDTAAEDLSGAAADIAGSDGAEDALGRERQTETPKARTTTTIPIGQATARRRTTPERALRCGPAASRGPDFTMSRGAATKSD
jgi:hypothetical protein